MTVYGLKSNIREKVLLGISVLSLIVGSILFPVSNTILLLAFGIWPKLEEFLEKWEFLGVFSAQLTVVVIMGFLTWLFNNYLWKTKPFIKILDIPNLNGKWVGALKSSHQNEFGEFVIVEMTLIIEQIWDKMKCTCTFSQSESFSDVIFLDTESSDGCILKFTYRNKSHDISCGIPQYLGYNELRLAAPNTLSGTYFTQRTPSTYGTILLNRYDPSSDINEDVTGS